MGILVASCARDPLVAYTLDTPPLVLAPASAGGVVDERGRFREILCAVAHERGPELPDHRPCEELLVRLAAEPPPSGRPVDLGEARSGRRVLVVPGLGAECYAHVVRTFAYAREHLERLGYPTAVIPVGGHTSPADNARQIAGFIGDMGPLPDKSLILVGHSKGAVDILEALVLFPELRSRIAAVVSIAGPIGGSPLADSPPGLLLSLVERNPFSLCEPGERAGLESLKRSTRLRWLADHQLPEDVRYFSLVALPDPERVSLVLRPFYDTLSEVDPRNDGMVVFYDAIIPGGVLLGYVRADHWAVAIPIARRYPVLGAVAATRNAFPREIMLEAVVRHVEERLTMPAPQDAAPEPARKPQTQAAGGGAGHDPRRERDARLCVYDG